MNKHKINFKKTLNCWGTDLFSTQVVDEIMSLKTGVLPLQHGLTQGDMASEQPTKVAVINSHETSNIIEVKLAVFFTEIISGCSCGDKPVDINGYCEMLLTIDKNTAAAAFCIID